MKFHIERDEDSREVRFSGSFTQAEFEGLRLNRLEREQLCSPANTAADVLLDLELIYRLHQEKQP